MGWITSFPTGESYIDIPPLLGLDAAGNTYICGAFPHFTVTKINQQGRWLWTAWEEGKAGSSDRLTAMWIDRRGNIYLAGHRVTTESELAVLKLNARGQTQWRDFRAGHAESISVNRHGEVVIGGFRRNELGFDQPLVVKWNGQGEYLWESLRPAEGRNNLYYVTMDDSGNVYSTGRDFRTTKYDSEGHVLWVWALGADTHATHVALGPRGQVVISGEGPGQVLTVALDSAEGALDWVASWETRADPFIADIQFDSMGSCYVVASVFAGEEQLLIKHSDSGRILWVNSTDAGQEAGDLKLAIGRDDCLYVTAATAGDGLPSDVITRKLDPWGSLVWSVTFVAPDSYNDLSAGIGLDARANVHVGVASYDDFLPGKGVWSAIQYVQH